MESQHLQTFERTSGKTAAIVLAAGQGRRMNSKVAKQYLLLRDKPVLYYSLRTFEESFIDEIILVTGSGEEEYCRREIQERYDFHKIKKIVPGGKERYHSVYQGLCALEGVEYVFIHDGARPFLSQDILERSYENVQRTGACVVGVPVIDTIKVVDDKGFVVNTPDRAHLWSVQTPQVFSYSIIRSAYDTLLEKEKELLMQGIRITDDAMVAETILKCPVAMVEGSYKNLKITTPEDLARAELLCKQHKYGI